MGKDDEKYGWGKQFPGKQEVFWFRIFHLDLVTGCCGFL
jgi:hypothetical protein